MKKLVLLCMLLLPFTLLPKEPNNLMIVRSGNDAVETVRTAKKVYVYVTFDKTILWETDLDSFLASKGKTDADKAKMQAKFLKKFDSSIKKGKKWGLERVEDPAQAKDGYLIIMNYDQCVPVPGIGAQGYGSTKIMKADTTAPVITGSIKCLSAAKTPADFNPLYQYSEIGQRFGDEIVDFLKGKDDKRMNEE